MAADDHHPGLGDDVLNPERKNHQRNKWLLIAIVIILIVGVAIGGGVGGVLATKSKNTAVPNNTTSSTPPASPAASYLAGCSGSSNQNITITSVNNVNYTILCYFDCPFNDIHTFSTPTLVDCIDYCTSNEQCKGVAFAFNTDGQEPQCWLKNDVKTSKAEGNADRVCVLRGS